MKLSNIIASFALATTLVSTSVAFADPVYLIAQIQVEDQDKFFNGYSPAAYVSLTRNQAKILVATPTVQTLEGEWVGNWTVVIEFPSQQKATAWYNSEDYKTRAIPLRLESTKFGNMIIAKGFKQPSQ